MTQSTPDQIVAAIEARAAAYESLPGFPKKKVPFWGPPWRRVPYDHGYINGLHDAIRILRRVEQENSEGTA